MTISSCLGNLLVIFTAILATIYAYFKWSYQYWKRRGVPYLEPAIPYGNYQKSMTLKINFGQETTELYRQMKTRGWKHCGVYGLTTPNWCVVDLELVKHVLAKDFSHFTDRAGYYNERDDPLSCHLFAVGGAKWRNLRAKLTPTFTSGKLKAMFQTVTDCGEALGKYVEEIASDREPIDIKKVLACFSTDVIGSCAFGLECNSFKDPDSPFSMYGNKFMRPNKLQFVKLIFCQFFPNLARSLRVKIIADDINEFYTRIVKDTVEYRQKNNVVRKDFLQLLIDNMNGQEDKESAVVGEGSALTMAEITAQSFVFFLAGYETSSTTMTFVLYELATHPEIQHKVRAEIKRVLAKHNNKVTYDSLSELTYMRQVIDETLRMFPALPQLVRECVQDYKVPGEDVIIEKGTIVIIPVQGIHYDEEYYKNPDEFDPERFSEENKETRSKYAHLAFGGGPRECIGERFGIMQTKVGLTSILRRFNVKLDERTKLPLEMKPISLVTTTKDSIWLRLEEDLNF